VATYRIVDPEKAASVVSNPVETLYKEAQLALRAAVGARALDAILEDKESLGAEVREVLVRRGAEFGVAVRGSACGTSSCRRDEGPLEPRDRGREAGPGEPHPAS